MGAFRTFGFIVGFLALMVLGLYSLDYSQGRVGYAGPVVDTELRGGVNGASIGDAWDHITASFTPLPDQAEKIATSNSITDSVARDFIDLYLQAKATGDGTVSPEMRDAIVGSAASYGKGYVDAARYIKADILISSTDTAQAHKDYLNALATIIDARFGKLPKRDFTQIPPELAAFQESLRTNNFTLLKKIRPYHEAYSGATKDLLALRTPSLYATNHLEMLNSFATSEESLMRVMQLETDPLGAIYGMRAYIEEYARGNRVTNTLSSFVTTESLTFSVGEPAYGLLRYLMNE